jgi:hypothetical protein
MVVPQNTNLKTLKKLGAGIRRDEDDDDDEVFRPRK